MPTVGQQSLTFADLAKRLGPNNEIAAIIEILKQSNPILDDAMTMEANNLTAHRTTVRTGLPETYWRLLNRGVPRSKSKTTQVDDAIGMLETWAVVDAALVDLSANKQAFMLSEHAAFLEAMNQRMAETLFYGNLKSEPAAFTGLAPRYSTVDAAKAESAKNVVDAKGTGNNLTSAWLCVWGDRTMHLVNPKGLSSGLKRKDFALTTVTDEDGNEFVGYKTNYSWSMGLVVRDWRFCVRVANIDTLKVADLIANGAATAQAQQLVRSMIQAYNLVPNIRLGRAAWYMNRDVKTMLDLMAAEKSNVNLTIKNFEGEEVTAFKGAPIRQCDAIISTEDQVV